ATGEVDDARGALGQHDAQRDSGDERTTAERAGQRSALTSRPGDGEERSRHSDGDGTPPQGDHDPARIFDGLSGLPFRASATETHLPSRYWSMPTSAPQSVGNSGDTLPQVIGPETIIIGPVNASIWALTVSALILSAPMALKNLAIVSTLPNIDGAKPVNSTLAPAYCLILATNVCVPDGSAGRDGLRS